MFEMHFDKRRKRLHLHVSGFWDFRAAGSHRISIRTALDEAGRTGPFTLLEDLTELKVQPRAVFSENRKLVAQLRGRPIVRHAMITTSALLRNQIRRLFDGNLTLQFFDDVAGAEAWLDEVTEV